MRGFIVMGMFAISFASAASTEYVEVQEFAVDAQGLSTMVIDAGAGSLSVTGVESADQIAVIATIRVEDRDEEDARKHIQKRMRLTLDRDGDTAELVADFDSGWGWSGNASIDLDVQMPRGIPLVVDDGSGSIAITDIAADVAIDDGSGSLEISNAGSIDIDDGSGSIRINGSTGNVFVNDGSGSIDIRSVAGTVRIDDGSGSITVDDVENDLIIEDAGSGSVSYTNVRGSVEHDD